MSSSMSTTPVNADGDSVVAAYRVGRAREFACEMGKRPTKGACITYYEGKELTDSRGRQLPRFGLHVCRSTASSVDDTSI